MHGRIDLLPSCYISTLGQIRAIPLPKSLYWVGGIRINGQGVVGYGEFHGLLPVTSLTLARSSALISREALQSSVWLFATRKPVPVPPPLGHLHATFGLTF